MKPSLKERIGVGAVVVSEDKKEVLLVRHKIEEGHGRGWTIVGGMVEEGEWLIDTLLRELEEEVGIKRERVSKAVPMRLIMRRGSIPFLIFLVEVSGKDVTPGEEIEEARWFSTIPRELEYAEDFLDILEMVISP